MVPFSFLNPSQVLNTDSVFAEEKTALLSPTLTLSPRNTRAAGTAAGHTPAALGQLARCGFVPRQPTQGLQTTMPCFLNVHTCTHTPPRTTRTSCTPCAWSGLQNSVWATLPSPHFLKLEAGGGEGESRGPCILAMRGDRSGASGPMMGVAQAPRPQPPSLSS